MHNKPAVQMLTLIIDLKDKKKAHAIFEAEKTPVHYLCIGEGTATNEVMDYLGLGTSEKAIFMCPVLKNVSLVYWPLLEKAYVFISLTEAARLLSLFQEQAAISRKS